ncbi:ribosomal protein S18-alanine N-acetyltransferase [Clostridium sp. MD294]|uniref:ribosomal protein S18-alanine N-acetyltransferase n=1 Tax=Clostridium sp. MD294 TaxID=97138 RepID=UPI000557B47F|nr:ribosomal protein S18-alanine N-acetyltransferase [Clostridium sp. MD294]NDO47776.1 ribosomal-protein-alanine N-acetyltransferase [Clostridium sp. MD294]
MTQEHIQDVLQIEEACFAIPWTKQAFEREIKENKLAMYIIAVLDGKIVGYAGMWHVVTEGHITNVAVLPEYRKQGIGNALIEQIIRIAEEYEMIGITLEVRISNIAAQKLYIKYGFRPEGFRKNYYEDTKEDAVIMWKYFPNYENYQPE